MGVHHKATKKKQRWAAKMRRKPTRAEALLWDVLRESKLGVRFYRQVVLLGWIADFWCPSLRLVVEVDGSAHDGRGAYDKRRALVMESELGARTFRVTNDDVVRGLAAVEFRLREEIRVLRTG